MRKTLLLLLLTAVFCGAFARKTPQVAPAPQVPDSLRGFYLFTEGIKQALHERDTAAAARRLERFRRSRFDLRARMVRTGRTAALQRCSHRPAPCRTRLPHRHDRQMVPAATGAGADSQRPLPRRDPHLQPAARGRRAESRLLPRAGDALRPGGATLLGDRCARFGGGAFRQDRRPVGTQTPPCWWEPANTTAP